MLRKPGFAIVAKDEAMHRLVGSVDLDLDKARLVAATLLAQEEALELVALHLYLLVLPVSPLIPHASHLDLVSFHSHLLAGKLKCVEFYKFLWCYLFIDEHR
jgi:hypothetical protein